MWREVKVGTKFYPVIDTDFSKFQDENSFSLTIINMSDGTYKKISDVVINLQKLANEFPKIINRASDNALRCFELLTGSPRTENELKANKKSQLNSECPTLANPNYKSEENS